MKNDFEVRIYKPEERLTRQQVGGNKLQAFEKGGENVSYVGRWKNFDSEKRPVCDAMWTNNSDQILEADGSDCCMLGVSDGERFGVLHTGYKNLARERNVISLFLEKFSQRDRIQAVIGPCIHEILIYNHKPTKKTFKDLRKKYPQYCHEEEKDIARFLFRDAIIDTLGQYGVCRNQVIDSDIDTFSNAEEWASRRFGRVNNIDSEENNYLCIGRKDAFKDDGGLVISLPEV